MAVTSIWPIKGRVDKVINYARNPEKTHDKERLSELHEIEGVVEYAADEMKTEKRAYVTCLNLHSEETAAQEFMETKRLMHNEEDPAITVISPLRRTRLTHPRPIASGLPWLRSYGATAFRS